MNKAAAPLRGKAARPPPKGEGGATASPPCAATAKGEGGATASPPCEATTKGEGGATASLPVPAHIGGAMQDVLQWFSRTPACVGKGNRAWSPEAMIRATFCKKWVDIDAARSGADLRHGRQAAAGILAGSIVRGGLKVLPAMLERSLEQQEWKGMSIEFGFDETVQSRTASVKASAGPSPEAVGTTVLSHVMTQTCALWSVLPDCTLGEEVVLPPSIVPGTSARFGACVVWDVPDTCARNICAGLAGGSVAQSGLHHFCHACRQRLRKLCGSTNSEGDVLSTASATCPGCATAVHSIRGVGAVSDATVLDSPTYAGLGCQPFAQGTERPDWQHDESVAFVRIQNWNANGA